MDILVDDVLVTTWTSSGSTEELEDIDLSGTEGQVIAATGVLDNSEWLSIIEVRSSLACFRDREEVACQCCLRASVRRSVGIWDLEHEGCRRDWPRGILVLQTWASSSVLF